MTDADHILENTDSIRTTFWTQWRITTDGTCSFICYAKSGGGAWLSDKVDVYQFIQAMDSYLWLPIAGLYRWERQSDLPFYTAETVVYIPNPLCPRSRQPRPSAAIRSPTPSRPTPAMTSTPPKRRATPPRRTTGAPPPVHPARSGRPTVFTPTHRPANLPGVITIPAPSAASASTMQSMSLPIPRIRRPCSRQKSSPTRITASIPRRRPTSACNAAARVLWLSCEYCGHSHRYLQQHLTSRDVYASGTGMTLAQYQAEANASLQWEETQALNTTELYPGTFTLLEEVRRQDQLLG